MHLLWVVDCLDRSDRQFKRRDLFLDTKTIDSVTKAALELELEVNGGDNNRAIRKYRNLFREVEIESVVDWPSDIEEFRTFSIEDYVEDQNGTELSEKETAEILTGSPHAVMIPHGYKQHDIDFLLSEKKPLRIADINLSPDHLKLFGYFVRDWRELARSAFLTEASETVSIREYRPSANAVFEAAQSDCAPVLTTAVSDDEIRSFVTIFRRLYMEREPACFLKAAELFSELHGDNSVAKWVAETATAYKRDLDSKPDGRPFVSEDKCDFTTKRLIDVHIYSQFAHQPDPKRQQQYKECLSAIHDQQSVLTWHFLSKLRKVSSQILNAGRKIVLWFESYCGHHKVTADVLASLLDQNPGIGFKEKKSAKRARLFREKTEELAAGLWKEKGRPLGGPMQFLDEAHEHLSKVIGLGLHPLRGNKSQQQAGASAARLNGQTDD